MYIEVYKDKAGEWRWRFRGANHATMADSGEGYNNRTDMFGAIEAVCGGWTTTFDYYDVAGVRQSTPVLNRHDGSSIAIRET